MGTDWRSPFPMAFVFLLLIVGEGGNSRSGTMSAGLPFRRRLRSGCNRFRGSEINLRPHPGGARPPGSALALSGARVSKDGGESTGCGHPRDATLRDAPSG